MFQDLRFAARTLWRSPVFAVGAIVTLALGIGVNATIFSLASSALFRPLAGIAAPERLVWLASMSREEGRSGGLSYPDYLDLRAASADVFAGMLAFRQVPMSLGSGGEPERIKGHAVSGSYFPVLGVRAAAGRLLAAPDDVRGPAAHVAVISYRLWKQRFGGTAEVLDSGIVINGRTFTVVGVAAEGFQGPALGEIADVWVPFATWGDLRASERGLLDERGSSWLSVMGRLRPGVRVERAQAVMRAAAARLETAFPATNRGRTIVVSGAGSPIPPGGSSEVLPLAALLLTVTAVVLIIACANVANLVLARGIGRSLEVSIRAAVGASRSRLVRQFLVESLVLAGAGAALGLLLSFWATDLLIALGGPEMGGLQAGIDPRVIAYCALLTIVSVCAFGLAPAVLSTRPALLPALRSTASARSGRRSRVQTIFVVTQLSLSLVLLLAAGLSLRALQELSRIDLGFEARNVVAASYDPVLQNYSQERRDAFRRDLIARVRALPGVDDAAMANLAPLGGIMIGATADLPGPAERSSRAYLNAVDAGYFSTLRIPILRGRSFTTADVRGTHPVAIVNETLARRLWGAQDPIGQTVRLHLFEVTTPQVVGVARDAKYDEPTEDPRPFLYLALAQQSAFDTETLLVRTAALSPAAIQQTIRAMDPALPIFDVKTFDAVLRDRANKQRAMSALFASFGVLAMLLAAVGLYGVVAFTTAQRTREMGVRLALGATPAQLTRLIARDGLKLALIGTSIGTALSIPVARVLGALVFGVGVTDIATYAAACAALIAVAVSAAMLPARRAIGLDPIAALRTE